VQNLFDFPPVPKLNVFGELDPGKATEVNLTEEEKKALAAS
jgi:hypothetical protein